MAMMRRRAAAAGRGRRAPHLGAVEPRIEGLYDGTMVGAATCWWSAVVASRPWLEAELPPIEELQSRIEPANRPVLTALAGDLFSGRTGETSSAALGLAYAMTHVIRSSLPGIAADDAAPRPIGLRHVEDSRWAFTPLAGELLWGEQRASLVEILQAAGGRHRHLPRTIAAAYHEATAHWGLAADQVVAAVDNYRVIRGAQKGYRLVFDRADELWFAERVDFAGAATLR